MQGFWSLPATFMSPSPSLRVELINTGSELLLGQVLNTHLQYLADALWPLGLEIARQSTVPDGPPIREVLLETFARAEVVLVTGGLGPTTDDLTRDIVAELLGMELREDPAIAAQIRERLEKRGIRLTDRIFRQAQRPDEAEVLTNRFGTAPGLYFTPAKLRDQGDRLSPHLFLLPGPPRELKPMVETEVLPRLRALLPGPVAREMRIWRVVGVPESHVEEAVGEALLAMGIEPGYCARPGEVDVRIVGTPGQIEAAGTLLEKSLGHAILPEEMPSLEHYIVGQLTERKLTVATVESCTGGGLANRITNVPGSSAVFGHGFVTYANEAKVALGVPHALLEAHGAVSAQVAESLARNAKSRSGADYALATTGIAGPGGGTAHKPVGTVHIGLAHPDGSVVVEHHVFQTDRLVFKNLVTQTALNLLRRALEKTPPPRS
jgi:nicotinamide-nucleotide amidase